MFDAGEATQPATASILLRELGMSHACVEKQRVALGTWLMIHEAARPLRISLRVIRDGGEVVADTVKVADLHRSPGELVAWLFRAQEFPVGVVLLTGTAIVPPADFTLRAGDEVIIATTGLGELRNVVETV